MRTITLVFAALCLAGCTTGVNFGTDKNGSPDISGVEVSVDAKSVVTVFNGLFRKHKVSVASDGKQVTLTK